MEGNLIDPGQGAVQTQQSDPSQQAQTQQADPAQQAQQMPKTQEDWRSYLSDEVKTEHQSFIEKYNSLDEVIKGGANASKKIGNSITLPGEDALPDEWGKVYNKLGRPENPEEYPDPKIKTYKADDGQEYPIFEIDKEGLSEAKKHFHSLGLNPKQMQGIMDLYADQRHAEFHTGVQSLEVEQTQMRQESEKVLMQEWGDKYDVNMRIAQKTINKFGLMDDIKRMGLGNSAQVAKMFVDISKHIGEAKLTGDYSEGGGGFEEARNRIIKSDAYNNPGHPDHRRVRENLNKLYESRYSDQ